MIKTYERKCPVCGEVFITKHPTKRFCCADCVAEYDDIKRYMYKRVKKIILTMLEQARTSKKSNEELLREFMRKW